MATLSSDTSDGGFRLSVSEGTLVNSATGSSMFVLAKGIQTMYGRSVAISPTKERSKLKKALAFVLWEIAKP